MTEHRTDILISRIVDRLESPAEWAEFRAYAATEPSAWELLAEAQRDNERMALLARSATDLAEHIELPSAEAAFAHGRLHFRRPLSAAAGWIAAACLLLAWIATGPAGLSRGPATQSAGISMGSADDALATYLDKGHADGVVLGELEPKMLLDSKPLANGKVEVTFVRQIVERRQVPSLVRFEGVDERGNAKPVLVRPALRGSM